MTKVSMLLLAVSILAGINGTGPILFGTKLVGFIL